MWFRTLKMVESGIKPVYVFEGKPPTLKGGTVRGSGYCACPVLRRCAAARARVSVDGPLAAADTCRARPRGGTSAAHYSQLATPAQLAKRREAKESALKSLEEAKEAGACAGVRGGGGGGGGVAQCTHGAGAVGVQQGAGGGNAASSQTAQTLPFF